MTIKSLEDLLQSVKSPVDLLRNSQSGPNVYPVVPPEYTNWRDEQRAWQETCVLFNQSYHMTDMYVEGPDALKLLGNLGINSFKGFEPNKAKQYVPCNYDGDVIGDVVLTYLSRDRLNLIGRPAVHNWVQFHAETGGYDVSCERDERTAARPGPVVRRTYRFQIQGPNAMKTMHKVLGKAPPELKFFNMTQITIAGHRVNALRHGMAGQPGFELFGPWEHAEEVRQALIEAGKDYGMHLVGARAYSSNTLESGWVPSPMPAVYSGEKMKAFRQWLPAEGYEAKASLGGSFVSKNIEDYYLTPYDIGYGAFVKFDHDFIGREALEQLAAKPPRRTKVTLALNDEDVQKVIASQYGNKGKLPYKYFDYPSSVYSTLPYDAVTFEGRPVGISTWIGYSHNERKHLTLAMLDTEHAKHGHEVKLVWGEPDGGTKKPTVERHEQTEIRAIVSPVPYSEVARISYAPPGWRTKEG
jgi:glycine cleavage system aminomethyltransferase T